MTHQHNHSGISVVLATYKEHDNLQILLPELSVFLDSLHRSYEVIIIDDDSKDGTETLVGKLRRKNPQIILHVRKNKRGLSSAICDGMNIAKYGTIIRMDADLCHTVNDLKKMLKRYGKKKQDKIVIGSRFLNESVYSGKPFLNTWASFLGRLITKYLLRLSVEDSSNNFRIIPRTAWERVKTHVQTEGNVFFLEEWLLYKALGIDCVEVPITYRERRLGSSKLNIATETSNFFKALHVLCTYDSALEASQKSTK